MSEFENERELWKELNKKVSVIIFVGFISCAVVISGVGYNSMSNKLADIVATNTDILIKIAKIEKNGK